MFLKPKPKRSCAAELILEAGFSIGTGVFEITGLSLADSEGLDEGLPSARGRPAEVCNSIAGPPLLIFRLASFFRFSSNSISASQEILRGGGHTHSLTST